MGYFTDTMAVLLLLVMSSWNGHVLVSLITHRPQTTSLCIWNVISWTKSVHLQYFCKIYVKEVMALS